MRWTSAVAIATWLASGFTASVAAQGTDDASVEASFFGPQRLLPPRTLTVPLLLDDETARLVVALDEMGFVAFGGIGYEGMVSDGEVATRRLAARPRAAMALAWLVVHGRPAARLYAYWALRRVDPVAARGYRARLHSDATSVLLITGCVGRTSTVASSARVADRRGF